MTFPSDFRSVLFIWLACCSRGLSHWSACFLPFAGSERSLLGYHGAGRGARAFAARQDAGDCGRHWLTMPEIEELCAPLDRFSDLV